MTKKNINIFFKINPSFINSIIFEYVINNLIVFV